MVGRSGECSGLFLSVAPGTVGASKPSPLHRVDLAGQHRCATADTRRRRCRHDVRISRRVVTHIAFVIFEVSALRTTEKRRLG